MSKISKVTPTPFDTRPMADIHKPYAPTADYAQIIATVSQEAVQRKWPEPDHGAGGVGPAYLYYDRSGKLLGERLPWKGTAADIFIGAIPPVFRPHPDFLHGRSGGDAERDRRRHLVAPAGVPRHYCGTPCGSVLKIGTY